MSMNSGRVQTTLTAGPIELTATPPGKIAGQQVRMPGAPIDLYFLPDVAAQWIRTLTPIAESENNA